MVLTLMDWRQRIAVVRRVLIFGTLDRRRQTGNSVFFFCSFPHRSFLQSITSFLFPINAHNMLNTYTCIFITNNLLHISMFVTPSSVRPLRYVIKNYTLFAILFDMLCYKMYNMSCLFFYLQWHYNFRNNMYFALLYLKNLKNFS